MDSKVLREIAEALDNLSDIDGVANNLSSDASRERISAYTEKVRTQLARINILVNHT